MTDIFDRKEYTRKFILNGKGLRRLADSSMNTYMYQLNRFFNFCESHYLDPDQFSEEGVKEYCAQSRTINELKGSIAALKLFFEFILHKPLMFRYIPFSQPERKLPDILSQEEIVMIMEQITNPKHLFIFILMYSTGLRISEVQNLKEADFLAPGSKSTFLYAQLSNTVMKQAGTPMARIKHKITFKKKSALILG